jgi:hypothetical protein
MLAALRLASAGAHELADLATPPGELSLELNLVGT